MNEQQRREAFEYLETLARREKWPYDELLKILRIIVEIGLSAPKHQKKL